MPTTANGDVSLYYETFGADDAPVLLLVNGLGSQSINFKDEFCEKFAGQGFRVVRFDNRDVGLSSHLKGGPHYTVDDMDAILARLQTKSIAILKRTDDDPSGRFAWILDPEGNKIELWEPKTKAKP